MLIQATTLESFSLESLDGKIGKLKEFYFDDQTWSIRYLVAETGNWLSGKQVLISPCALGKANRVVSDSEIKVNLTKKQIEESPSLEDHKPVSQQVEKAYNDHYGYPTYYSGPLWCETDPNVTHDRQSQALAAANKERTRREHGWDPHLRSTSSVSGHHVQARDGELGHVEDFIIDDKTWAIRYLIISTHNWWPGKKVLVSPKWIERICWDERKVFVNLCRETIKQLPDYTEKLLLTRDYEEALHRHYNRPGYWIDNPAAQETEK